MASSNAAVFCNGIFVFEVDGCEHTAHRDLVARTSRSLKAMMENGMRESRKGHALIQDTTGATFVRFLEFAYTGNYNPAGSESPKSKENTPKSKLDQDWWRPSGPCTHPPSFGRDNFLSGYIPPKAKIPSLEFNIRIQRPLFTASGFTYDTDDTVDYLPVFLSHAELYVFADTYQIPWLKDLTADRLQTALAKFEYRAGSTTDVAKLVAYVYEHTADRDQEIDVLRAIVTNFCANNKEALSASDSFLALLQQGGRFAAELFVKSNGAPGRA